MLICISFMFILICTGIVASRDAGL